MEAYNSEYGAECADDTTQSTELVLEKSDAECGQLLSKGDVDEVKYVNTQDYLEIGETVISQCARAAPDVATMPGYIKEEHIDPDDAHIRAETEKIRQLIFIKKGDGNETVYFKKLEGQFTAASIIPKMEDEAANMTTPSDISEEPCRSSELQIMKEQVASWQVILYRLPTDTPLSSTTTSDGRVETVDDANNCKFNAIEDVPHKEAPNDVTDTEEVDEIGRKNVASKKLVTYYNRHNHMKKQKSQTETKKVIHVHDTEFKISEQKKCEQKNYICDHCQLKFNSKMKLRDHIFIHGSTSKTNPSVPAFNYKYVQLLKKHSRLHDENSFACNLCTYSASSNQALQRHYRVHRGKKQYKWTAYDFAIAQLGNLKTHMTTHTGEKLFKYDTCDYVSSHLKRHKLRIHRAEMPYKCETCDYASSQLNHVKSHMRTHTSEKPYKCKTCDYAGSHLINLKAHLRIHTGKKPFKCDICNYASPWSGPLKRHMRAHTSQKSFKCDTCDFATSKSRVLKNHMRKHTDGKPYR